MLAITALILSQYHANGKLNIHQFSCNCIKLQDRLFILLIKGKLYLLSTNYVPCTILGNFAYN